MHKISITAAFAALSLPCLAQDFIGFSYNVAVGATSRGAIGTAAGENMTRIDGSEFAGWGTNTPGFRTIASLFFVLQDQNGATPETCSIKLYPEDTSNPGFPDLTYQPGVFYATGVTGPTGTGIVAVAKILPPTTVGVGDSVPIQGGGDVFVSWSLPAAAGWPATDGISVNIVLGYAPSAAFLVFDLPSADQGSPTPPPGAPSNSHGLSRTGAGAATYSGRRSHFMDVAHSTAAGIALSITNQTSFTPSNNPPPATWGPAPGTASMMSGSNPDINGDNPGRVDDLTMEYYKTGLGATGLVVFLMDIAAGFGPEIPVGFTGFPGTGVVCVTGTFAIIGFGLTVADEAWLVTPIPTLSRPTLGGTLVIQQAAAFDVGGLLHMSPCRLQTL